jgi:P4 family phage/plasmid primase-like protien
MKTLQAAQNYLAAGYSVIPVKLDGSKRPDGEWERYQTSKPTNQELTKWFPNDTTHGIGLVQGTVSGHAEMLEFETDTALTEWEKVVSDHGRADLLDLLNLRVRSGGGGIHFYYRCPEGIEGNQKLARFADGTVKIETRGEGGQVVAPGSPPNVHASKNPYVKISGSFESVPSITAEDRTFAFAMARACNEHTPSGKTWKPKNEPSGNLPSGNRPGDDYNARTTQADIIALLEFDGGWQVAGGRGDVCDMTRPGKKIREGTSGTVGYCGNGFYCFTSSAPPFEPETYYSPFSVYTLLKHGGDFVAAARTLGQDGFGEQPGERIAQAAKERYSPPPDNNKDDFFDRETPKLYHAAEALVEPATEKSPEERIYLTDLGNARRLVDRHGKDLRYSPALGWLTWNGKRWKRDESGQVERWAKETVMAMYGEAAALLRTMARETNEEKQEKLRKRAEALQAWAKKSQGAKELGAMQKLAKTEPGMYVSIEALDISPWLLNCQNGTLDLRTGKLATHQREDMLTKVIPVAYDPEAACPIWEKFLLRVLPDTEVRAYVQRATGYSLTGDVGEQCLFFFYGDGSNGKSTFLKTMLSLTAGYGQQAPADLLIVKQGNSIPNDVAALRGTRLVATIEVEDGKRMAEGLMKQITGGDVINARFMRGEWFQFDPTFKIFLAANHRPQIATGDDFAVWRRIKVIPFTERIEEDEKDPRLVEKLRAERSGILAWAVRGCLNWQANGMQEPAAVRASIEAYRAVSDVIGRFIEEDCVLKPTVQVKASQLYAAYTKWCGENGHRPMSSTKFGELMGKRDGIEKVRSGGMVYLGIGICHQDSGNLGDLEGLEGLEPNSDMRENITSSQEPHIKQPFQPFQPFQRTNSDESEDTDDPFAPGGSMWQSHDESEPEYVEGEI